MNGKAENTTTFWDHLDELRSCLIRIIMITIAMGALAFCMKDTLFDIVLAPPYSNFVTYRLLDTEPFTLHLMNTGLTEQFMIHMKTALYAGLLLSSPYVLYVLFGFVAPALYENERRIAIKITMSAYVMFILGTLLNYFLIFPLTVHFLGTYQVSTDVDNMLTLQSYIPASPHSGHCHRSRHYHPHHRCLHTLRRVNAHLAAVRTEHTDSKNDRK